MVWRGIQRNITKLKEFSSVYGFQMRSNPYVEDKPEGKNGAGLVVLPGLGKHSLTYHEDFEKSSSGNRFIPHKFP